jgi:hypothetical protein
MAVISQLIGLPVLLVVAACVPVLNSVVFSGHGGPGWILLLGSFPLLLLNTYRLVIRPGRGAGGSPWMRAVSIVVAYLVLAFPCGMLAEHMITSSSGLPIEDYSFYRGLTFPVGLALPPWHQPRPAA